MLKSQLLTLTNTGNALLEKASACTKAQDAKTFAELALKCLSDARDLARDLQNNSILFYCECYLHLKAELTYRGYLDFCARNGLEIASEVDFEAVLVGLEVQD